jgi:hypothetical protein
MLAPGRLTVSLRRSIGSTELSGEFKKKKPVSPLLAGGATGEFRPGLPRLLAFEGPCGLQDQVVPQSGTDDLQAHG